MTIVQKSLTALIASTLISVGANAAITFDGQPYIGIKVGQFDADVDKASSNDDATGFGIYGGYNFDPYFGAELEYVTSNDADVNFNGNKGEYDVKTIGAYGTYRYHFPVNGLYAKGKLGIAKTEVDASANSLGNKVSSNSDDTSLAGGIGLGYNIAPNISVEGEYELLGGDADLLSLGAQFKF